jgi:hypothetical protein
MKVQILVQPVLNGEAQPVWQEVLETSDFLLAHADVAENNVNYELGEAITTILTSLDKKGYTGLAEDGWSFRVLITKVQRDVPFIPAVQCNE